MPGQDRRGTRGWEIEHLLPLALGGADDDDNRKPAHRKCHLAKTRQDIKSIRKADRQRARYLGAKTPSRHPLPGGRDSKWKIKLDGTVVER